MSCVYGGDWGRGSAFSCPQLLVTEFQIFHLQRPMSAMNSATPSSHPHPCYLLFLSFWPGTQPLCLPKQGCSDAFFHKLSTDARCARMLSLHDPPRLTGSPALTSLLMANKAFPGAAQSSVRAREFLPCFLYF